MAFDAGLLKCVVNEIDELKESRVEKIYQPDRDEIHIQIRSIVGGKRLLINAGSNNPRIGCPAMVTAAHTAQPSVKQPSVDKSAIFKMEKEINNAIATNE